jgi:hypothetical protein
MVRKMICFVAAVALATPALAVGKPGDVSWGKANVSYASYNEDAQQCANQAYGVSVMMKRDTAEALGAIQRASYYSLFSSLAFNGPDGQRAMIEAVSPDRVMFRNTNYEGLFDHAAWVDVVEQLQQVVDSCLTARGYHRFRLSGGQRERLHRLKPGTMEREHFLHALGSDPRVISAQAI